MPDLKPLFDEALAAARAHRAAGRIAAAWAALERAHILGQTRAWLHARSHAAMLRLALATRDWPEVRGQVLRLVFAIPTAALGTAPLGNPGRTRDGHGPVPIADPELRALLASCGVAIEPPR